MGPRRKFTKTIVMKGTACASLPKDEPKDYINEFSHEVLCHIFRLVLYTYHATCSNHLQCSILLIVVTVVSLRKKFMNK